MELEDYGLKGNPFEANVAQKPNDPNWAFCDLQLDREESKPHHSLLKVLSGFVTRLKEGKPGRRGILIAGTWGTGKTQCLRKLQKDITPIFKTVYVDFWEKLDTVKGRLRGGSNLPETITSLVFNELGIQFTPTSNIAELWCNKLSTGKVLVLIDQLDNLNNLKEVGASLDQIRSFLLDLGAIADKAQVENASLGIAAGVFMEFYEGMKNLTPYFFDRFDIVKFQEGLSIGEIFDLYKSRVRPFRSEKFEQIWNSKKEEVEKDNQEEGLWITQPEERKAVFPFSLSGLTQLKDI